VEQLITAAEQAVNKRVGLMSALKHWHEDFNL